MTDLARAAWLLGAAALVLGACEVLDWLTDDERITWRDVAFVAGGERASSGGPDT